MLAAVAALDKIKYPVFAQPKLDGIRCLVKGDQVISRTGKSIPNDHIRAVLSAERFENWVDGELLIPGGDFNEVQSAVMSRDGKPNFQFVIYDVAVDNTFFLDRLEILNKINVNDNISVIKSTRLWDHSQLMQYKKECMYHKFEGVMLRNPNSFYKHGRATNTQGELLKIKDFLDAEATIVDIIERFDKNKNPCDTAGALVLDWNGVRFKAGFGKGTTDLVKDLMWSNKSVWIGSQCTFTYQELSAKGVPRFPKFLRLRDEE
jgi:DNA ligase-1